MAEFRIQEKVFKVDIDSKFDSGFRIESCPRPYHVKFITGGIPQKNLTEIWHQIWDKNDSEIYAIKIIFKSHEPFQRFQLTGPA